MLLGEGIDKNLGIYFLILEEETLKDIHIEIRNSRRR